MLHRGAASRSNSAFIAQRNEAEGSPHHLFSYQRYHGPLTSRVAPPQSCSEPSPARNWFHRIASNVRVHRRASQFPLPSEHEDDGHGVVTKRAEQKVSPGPQRETLELSQQITQHSSQQPSQRLTSTEYDRQEKFLKRFEHLLNRLELACNRLDGRQVQHHFSHGRSHRSFASEQENRPDFSPNAGSGLEQCDGCNEERRPRTGPRLLPCEQRQQSRTVQWERNKNSRFEAWVQQVVSENREHAETLLQRLVEDEKTLANDQADKEPRSRLALLPPHPAAFWEETTESSAESATAPVSCAGQAAQLSGDSSGGVAASNAAAPHLSVLQGGRSLLESLQPVEDDGDVVVSPKSHPFSPSLENSQQFVQGVQRNSSGPSRQEHLLQPEEQLHHLRPQESQSRTLKGGSHKREDDAADCETEDLPTLPPEVERCCGPLAEDVTGKSLADNAEDEGEEDGDELQRHYDSTAEEHTSKDDVLLLGESRPTTAGSHTAKAPGTIFRNLRETLCHWRPRDFYDSEAIERVIALRSAHEQHAKLFKLMLATLNALEESTALTSDDERFILTCRKEADQCMEFLVKLQSKLEDVNRQILKQKAERQTPMHQLHHLPLVCLTELPEPLLPPASSLSGKFYLRKRFYVIRIQLLARLDDAASLIRELAAKANAVGLPV